MADGVAVADAAHVDGRGVLRTSALALVRLAKLMEQSEGSRTVRIVLVDGPVAVNHPDLIQAHISPLDGHSAIACQRRRSTACAHGTFIAGIFAARRGSPAPGICPGCTLLVRPIFPEVPGAIPTASPEDVATAIAESVAAGARVVNLSAATGAPTLGSERRVHGALDYAARRGVLVVAAAGNQATLGSSAITRHPWVIPVVACDRRGRPLAESNLGISVGRRGLGAPGESIESLDPEGSTRLGGGTSSATAFVTGAIALLASLYPEASATTLKRAVTNRGPRRAVTPPLLDADGALDALKRTFRRAGRA